MSNELKELYSPPIFFNSEGSRLALVTCLKCGAAVMFEPLDFTPGVIHLEWHKALERGQ